MDFKFFKKENKNSKPEEAPLNYWEKESYLMALPSSGYVDVSEDTILRVRDIAGVDIIESALPDEEKPGHIVLSFEDEIYEIGFYKDGFSLPEMLSRQGYYFTEEEMEAIARSESALTVFMEFPGDSRKAYHLQLKVVKAMVPDLLAVMDESAERLVSGRWVTLATESNVAPSAQSLFTVQAVGGENGSVWLHTHGLNRCGLYELEVLGSDQDNYSDHFNVINTFASILLDSKDRPEPGEGVRIGMFDVNRPMVATYVSWTKGLSEYPGIDLGGIEDRRQGHNTKTAIVFLYKEEKDEMTRTFRKVSEFNGLWADNPLFFISTRETERMSALARERFGMVKYMAEKNCPVILKIALRTDHGESEDDHEHIWFELIRFDGDEFEARLTQEPYDVSAMHTGDVGRYSVDNVTDWLIQTPDFTVAPDNAYLLLS